MEASSTSINISGNVPIEVKPPSEPPTHNHKYPNFGRYVEGCAACHAKYPDGPPKRGKSDAAKNLEAEVERLKAELAKSYTQTMRPASDDSTRQLAEIMLRREAKQLVKEEELEQRHADELRQMHDAHAGVCQHRLGPGSAPVQMA